MLFISFMKTVLLQCTYTPLFDEHYLSLSRSTQRGNHFQETFGLSTIFIYYGRKKRGEGWKKKYRKTILRVIIVFFSSDLGETLTSVAVSLRSISRTISGTLRYGLYYLNYGTVRLLLFFLIDVFP